MLYTFNMETLKMYIGYGLFIMKQKHRKTKGNDTDKKIKKEENSAEW